jgi:hypothetical protein
LKQHAEAEAEALPPILQRYIHQEDGMTKANFVTTLVTLAFTAAPCATSIAEQAAVLDAEAQKALQRAVALGVDEATLRERVQSAQRSAAPVDWVEETLRAARERRRLAAAEAQ